MSNRIGRITVFRKDLEKLSKPEIWTDFYKKIFPRRKRPSFYRTSTRDELIDYLMNYREENESRVRRTMKEEKKEEKKETKAQKEKRNNLEKINNLLDDFKIVNRDIITENIEKSRNDTLRKIIEKLKNMKERNITVKLSYNYIKNYVIVPVEDDNWINNIEPELPKEENKQEYKLEEIIISYKVYNTEVEKKIEKGEIKYYHKTTGKEYKGKDFLVVNKNGKNRYFTCIRYETGRLMKTQNSQKMRDMINRKFLFDTTAWDDFLDEVSVYNEQSLKDEKFLEYEWQIFVLQEIDFAINVKGVPKNILLKEKNQDTSHSVLHHNEYMNITLNKEAKTLEELFQPNISDYIKTNQTTTSCGFDCIIQTFKNNHDKFYKKKQLTYDSLRSFFSNERENKENIQNEQIARIRFNKLLDEEKIDETTRKTIDDNIKNTKTLRGLLSSIDKLKDIKKRGININWKNIKNHKIVKDVSNFKDDSVSIEELTFWFEKNGKKLRVYDENENGNLQLFYEYVPKVINSDYHPTVCHIFKKDRHLYCLDNKIKMLEKFTNKEEENDHEIYVSSNYNYKLKDIQPLSLSNFFDIQKISFDDYKEDNIIIYTNTDIPSIIYNLRAKCKYDPKILSLKSIIIRFGGKTVNIRNHESDFAENTEQIVEYTNYTKKLRNIFINQKTISHYPEDWLNIAFAYTPKAINHTIANVKNDNDIIELDYNKCYANALQNLEYIPAVNKFDSWRPFNYDLPVYDTYFYLIERDDDIDIPQQYRITFLLEKFTIYTGKIIHKIPYEFYKIIAYCPVSIIHTIDNKQTKQIIREINESSILTDKMKKDIPNYLTGNLEKTINRKELYRLFTDKETHTKDRTLYPIHNICTCEGGILDCSCIKLKYSRLYKEEQLEDGFYPIKMMVYMKCREGMFTTLNTVLENNKNVQLVRILTDALFFKTKEELKGIDEMINNQIGGIKIKRVEQKYFKTRERKSQKVPFIEKEKQKKEIKLNNEHLWKENPELYTREVLNVFKENKSIMIKGQVAGSGKTTIAKMYVDKFGDSIFLCPTNKRAISLMEEGYNAATLCSEIGINPFDDTKRGKFSVSNKYTTIIIEEVYAYSIKDFQHIYKLKQKNPTIKFIGTGDKFQNRLDNNRENNYTNIDEYYDMMVSKIFDCELMLNIGKRYKTIDDEKEIREYKDMIFRDKKEFIDKYPRKISTLDEVKYDDNTKFISLLNKTTHSIHKYFRGDDILIKNTSVIARNKKLITIGNVRIYNRMDYKIVDFDDEIVQMYDRFTKTMFNFPRNDFYDTFITDICQTSFSTQGDTYKNSIVVLFDIHHHNMSSNTIYTTLTRSDTPQNFYIFTGGFADPTFGKKAGTEDSGKISTNLNIARKIDNYKNQDSKKGRIFDDDKYVDKEWVIDVLEKQDNRCYYEDCGKDILHSWTIDRKYNELPHHKENCVLACNKCNVSKTNKKSF